MEHKMNRRGRTSSSSLPVHLLGRGRGRGRGRGWDFSRAQEGPDTREDLYRQCGPHLTAGAVYAFHHLLRKVAASFYHYY